MKEKKDKLRVKVFRFTIISLFMIFLAMYLGNIYGYFEYKNHEKMVLTQAQIKQFEQDVKDGKTIDLENYKVNTNKNYQTKLSKTGLTVSNGISYVVKEFVEEVFSSINKMVTQTE